MIQYRRRISYYPAARRSRGHNTHAYHLATTYAAHGIKPPPGLGDFFGDVMKTIIPEWDNRPDWMKKLVVKPDPAKLLQQAQKVVSPGQAGAAVDKAAQFGFNIFANTPGGQVPVTGNMVAGAYQYGPGFLNLGNAVSSIPIWVYGVAGLAALALIVKK